MALSQAVAAVMAKAITTGVAESIATKTTVMSASAGGKAYASLMPVVVLG